MTTYDQNHDPYECDPQTSQTIEFQRHHLRAVSLSHRRRSDRASAHAETPTASPVKIASPEEASLHFTEVQSRVQALELLRSADLRPGSEVLFRLGEWSGGVVVGDDSSKAVRAYDMLMQESPLGEGEFSFVGIRTDQDTAARLAAQYPGPIGSANAILEQASKDGKLQEKAPIPRSGSSKSVPERGALTVHEYEGLVVIEQAFSGLNNENGAYGPRWLNAGTGEFPNWVQGSWSAYEHNFTLLGQCSKPFVAKNDDYSWSSNIPGAYRDVRASDDKCQALDFTIGSYHPHMATRSSVYYSTIYVDADTYPTAEATLSNSVLSIHDLPTCGNADPWCVGLWGEEESGQYYIDLNPVTISHSGTCYRWIHGRGGIRFRGPIGDCETWLHANPAPAPVSFVDVDSLVTPYSDEIDWVAKWGITTGWQTSAGREFRPAEKVDRNAMVAFLYRLSGEPAYTPPSVSPFTDIGPGGAFYKEISWAYSKGISTGWAVGSGREFRPWDSVERDAMAAFLYRLAGSPAYTPPTVSPFVDIGPADSHYKEVAWMNEMNISTGWVMAGGSEYRPWNHVERDAMAAFMRRYSKLPLHFK